MLDIQDWILYLSFTIEMQCTPSDGETNMYLNCEAKTTQEFIMVEDGWVEVNRFEGVILFHMEADTFASIWGDKEAHDVYS